MPRLMCWRNSVSLWSVKKSIWTTAILRFKFFSGERRIQESEERFARLVFGNEFAKGGDERGKIAFADGL